jgi:predicted cupin superfamily sugar epimerase
VTADEVAALLGLAPHPEGGWYRETFRDQTGRDERGDGRGVSSAIYYLLAAGERSHWHRVDAAEVWHHYAGAPLELSLANGAERSMVLLGSDLAAGQRPQGVAPKGWWQAAKCLGDWTLVGCTVAPGFQFSGFEMAPEGWEPAAQS